MNDIKPIEVDRVEAYLNDLRAMDRHDRAKKTHGDCLLYSDILRESADHLDNQAELVRAIMSLVAVCERLELAYLAEAKEWRKADIESAQLVYRLALEITGKAYDAGATGSYTREQMLETVHKILNDNAII